MAADHPDVVHTHNPNIHHYGAVAAALARVPVVVNTRHSPLSSKGLLYSERNFRWATKLTDAVVFVSEQTRQAVKEPAVAGLRSCNIFTAIPIEPYRARPAQPLAALPRVRFGTLGRMVPAKAHEILIDAFSQVASAIPSATLRIAGGGELYGSLKDQAARLGLEHCIGIEEATDEPAAFLADLDVFVLSSRTEGLPLVLLEAMAAGVPVVATKVGGIPEVLSEDVGWLCPAGDSAALAEKMIEAVNCPDLLARAARGVAIVIERHSINAMANQYCELFTEILSFKRTRQLSRYTSTRAAGAGK